ncbi:MAG: class I SAM-dependent methyltransferase [Candidatus Vecturithrix sp.]|jgi:ubiquinone/menaquinone biosynthesis C-methylase UbiE|nr:class I SAM-dependent methyltransferase [Candidatus Vecturithrix sp.]
MSQNVKASVDTPDSFERRTREIFHALHKQQGENAQIFQRLTALLSPAYLQVPEDFFHGKICLDAGCGSNANATYSMLQQGAARVYAFDLDDTIFETVPRHLQAFEGKYVLSTDNVLQMRFENNFFDVVHCSGVLHHTADLFAGLKELARVTKPGGLLYIMTYGKGGLIRDIVTYLRGKYQQDQQFANFVDTLDAAFFTDLFQMILCSMQAHGDDLARQISPEIMHTLFDEDLVLTIKDRITAPAYHEHDADELISALREYGFAEITRLTRYPEFTNIRRFLSPFYEQYDSEFAGLLYGSGSIQLKAVKRI